MKTRISTARNLLTAKSWCSCLQFAAALAVVCWSLTAHAQGYQTDTWNGGGADNNWATAANWNTAVTTNGDDLIFTGTTRLTPANNFTGLQIDSITFNASGFVVSGNALTITNGITDNTGSNTCSIPLTLGASQTFQNTAGGTTNTESGTIAIGTNNLTIGGSGDVFLTGAITSTNGGIITVNSGIGRLSATANLFGTNTPDVIVINGGTLQVGNTTGIPSGPSVGNVLDNGTLDLNGTSPTINGLEGGGLVDNILSTLTSVYTLTVGSGNSNAVFSGTIQNTTGSVALTKTGYGTETLNGNNYNSGLTTISQGTLAVGPSGSLGLASKSMVISPGAVLDVSALNPNGYYPQLSFNLNAGTPTKPYTNFFGSYNTNYPNFTITTNFSVLTTNITYTTNGSTITTNTVVSNPTTTNSIVSIINYDVNGNFSLYGGSFTPVAPSPGIATFSVNGNLTLDNSLNLGPNNLNYLLNNTTTPGGGTNDLIVVNGTLRIGDTVNIVVSPLTGTLAAGQYTLIESTNFIPNSPNGAGPANFNVIAPRGISGVIDTASQPGNVLLTASGTATPGSIVWAGNSTANDNWDIHVTQAWKNGGVPDYFYSLDSVTFDDTGFGTVNLPGPVTPGSIIFNNNNTNYTFTAGTGGFISGNGGLTLNGSGTVTLNNPNSFTGNTTINNGTLILGAYGIAGAVLLYNGVAPGQLIMSGPSTFEQNESLANLQQSTTFSALTLNPGANAQIASNGRGSGNVSYMAFNGLNRSVGSSLYVNYTVRAGSASSGVYFTNTIPLVNGLLGGWAHVGTDWLIPQTTFLAAAPASGVLAYAGYTNNGALATWLSTNNMSVSNASFALTASATINSLKVSGPATVTISSGVILTNVTGGLLVSSAGAGPSTITGGTIKGAAGADLIVLQNDTTAPLANNALTIGSVIADNGSATALTLGGLGGTVILTNNNTYSGPTYINAGSLQVGAGSASGSIANSSSIIDSGGTLSFNRPDATSVGAVNGTGGLTQLGTGTLTLTANNTLKGLATISAGTLQVGNGGAAGSISNITGVVDSGTLAFNNSGTLGYRGVISGIGGVVQSGSGTLILGTNETYSGNTIVSNGVLALSASGSISNAAAIVVNAGATFDASAVGGLTLRTAAPSEILAGNGTVNGTVNLPAGTKIIPGTNGVVGTLTFNNDLNLNGGNLIFDVTNSPGTSDKILVAGVLNQNSGNVLINVIGTPLANGLYPLAYATSGLNGTSAANLVAIGFLQSGQLAVLTNSTPNELDLYVYSGVAPSLTWQGDGSQNLWDTTGSSIWQGSAQYQQGDYVTFNDSGSASPDINLDIVEYPATVTVNSSVNNYTFGVSGGSGANRISGGATLTKNGTSTLTLQTVNDYSGSTTINGGVVQLNGDGGANDDGMVGSGNVTNNGILIANNANTETLAGNLNGNGLLVQQGVGKLVLAGNNTAYAGPITLSNLLQVGNGLTGTLGSGNVTNNGTLIFDAGGSIAYNGNIAGSGNVTNLAGTVTLNGTNTYPGSTVVSGGTLRVGSAGTIPNTTTLVLNNNTNGSSSVGTLDLNGFSPVVSSLVGTNTGNGLSTLAESLIVNNGSGTSTLTINGGTTNTYNGQILDNNNAGSGKVALSIINGSYLTIVIPDNAVPVFPFPNNFTGGVTISNATLALGSGGGSSTAAGVANAGTAAIGSSGTQSVLMTGTNAVLYAAAATGSSSPTLQTTIGSLTVTPNTTAWIFGAQRGQFNTATLAGSGNIIYETEYVRDRLTFGNASGFTGTITFGILVPQSNAGGNIGYDGTAGLPNAAVVFSITNLSGIAFAGTVAGNVLPFGSLSGGDNTVVLSGGTTPSGDGTAATIYAIGGLNTSTTFGGQFVDAGCGIRKVGTGTLTLTNNTLSYGNQTVVSNGVLALAPVSTNSAGLTLIAKSSTYLIGTNFTLVTPGILDVSAVGGTLYLGHNGTQTLYGNGTLNGSLVATNSTIAPGRRASSTTNYTGSNLTVTNTVTLLTGSTVVIGINRTNSPTSDSLTAVSIAYGGTLTVTNLGDTAYANSSTNVFQLFNGALSGTFTATNLPAVTNSYWNTSQLGVNGSISLVNTNPAVNTSPATANFKGVLAGNSLQFTWAPDHLGWQLYTNSVGLTASTSWFPVPGSASVTNETITINPANPKVFFQLRYP